MLQQLVKLKIKYYTKKKTSQGILMTYQVRFYPSSLYYFKPHLIRHRTKVSDTWQVEVQQDRQTIQSSLCSQSSSIPKAARAPWLITGSG